MRMSIELKEVKKALEMYDAKKVRQATRSTLDKTVTFMKKRLIELITEIYNIPATELRPKKIMESVRTTMTELVATLKIKGKRIALYKFPHSRMPKGIVATVKLGKSFFILGGFVQTMPTGHVGIFRRKIFPWPKGKGERIAKLRMRHYAGPSIPEIIGSEGFRPKVEKEAGEYMEKLLLEEIDKRIYRGVSKP